MSKMKPIACTLDPASRRDRGEEWRRLRADALLAVGRNGAVVTTTWRPEARERVAALVDAERRCCAFVDFAELEEAPGGLVLRAVFPPGAESVAEALFPGS
jgi:hypothetical protein